MRKQKKMLIAAIIILIIAAAGFYLLYANGVNNSNNSALIRLNSQIGVYGANMRYLLNSSASYDQVFPNSKNYQILLNLSSPFGSIGSVLNATGTKMHNSQYNNWGSYNPTVWATITNNLTVLGLVSSSDKANVLKNADSLRSTYAFIFASEDLLSIAQSLGVLFQNGAFSNKGVSESTESRKIAIFECEWVPLETGEYTELTGINSTNIECSNNYTMPIVATPFGWMGFITGVNSQLNNIVGNQTAMGGTKSTMLYRLLYKMTLAQYEGYQLNGFLYDKTIPPSLGQIIYTNNTLLVNLGNLNLTSTPAISLEIDGKEVGYKRYFNWLVADVNLTVGKHEIDVKLSNNALYNNINVSPYISINNGMPASGANQNGTLMPSKLSVRLDNTAYNSISISAIYGPFSKFGPAIKNETINTNDLVLARNSSFTINYTVPDGCQTNEEYIDGLEFNTSYGPAVYWLTGRCI